VNKKKRLDQLLVERDIFTNRSQAKRAIMAGNVYVDGECIDKAGTLINPDKSIELKDEMPYVSRGGLKLEKALGVFSINPSGKEAFDIGASTGGFTDCLLQHGARRVYAIDVGYGQLAWKLRQDERVQVMERTNFRYLTPENLPVKVELIVTDVSFISLRLIIPPALKFLKNNGEIIALVKPQFEAGPDRIGKKGVIRDYHIHKDVLIKISHFFLTEGLLLKDLDYSPITGAASGNIEFLIYLQKTRGDNDFSLWENKIDKVVEMAHQALGGG
jgi:23S rRNA (cytidine1920-2'-O)/16S rRNA (cytidine1409-2'-O)-methyltransferase